MKRILVLIMICSISVIGCAKAKVEKEPVIITDLTEQTVNEDTALPTETPDPTSGAGSFIKPTDKITVINKEYAPATPAPSKKHESQTDITLNTDRRYTAIIELEGTDELVNYETYDSPLGYHMAYDIDRFTVFQGDGIDIYTVENPDPEVYPYIYISIAKGELKANTDKKVIENTLKTYDKVSLINEYYNANITDSVLDKYYKVFGSMKFDDRGVVMLGEYQSYLRTYQEGTEWNSIIRNMYNIEKGTSSYEIEVQYYYEASEGYGARIKEMLNTLVLN